MRSLRSSQMLTVIFAVLFAIGFFILMLQIRPSEVTILVPTRNIGPYEAIDPQTDFKKVKVRENKQEDMAQYELTPKYINDLDKKNPDSIFFAREALLENERVDRRAVSNDTKGSIALVNTQTERVISVSTTLAGSVAGIIKPGDIVDVQGSGGTGAIVDNVKVIAFGVGANAGRQVAGGQQAEEEGSGGLLVVLAVPKDQAKELSGQTVNLVLNPFCTVNDDKEIVAVEGADEADCPDGAGSGGSDEGEEAEGADAGTGDGDTDATEEEPTEDGSSDSGGDDLNNELQEDLS